MSTGSATGTALGKVILLGEHAVVYGAPALAAGIDRGARARAEILPAGAQSSLRIASGHGALSYQSQHPGDEPAESQGSQGSQGPVQAFAALLAEGDPLPPVAVTAESDIPPGAGLGSSAALGVAIARAALAAAGRPVTDAEAIARATAWERVFHGNPSGIDTAAAGLGGCFRFTRADGVRPLAPSRDLVLCIGLTGVSVSTREMVEGVARLRGRKPEMVDRAIEGIAALVSNAALAVEAGDLAGLGQLMNLNQMILAGLMLSTEGIEQLCALARSAGALGAKLTGKGGGGSVLALAGDEAQADHVIAAWRSAGHDGFVTRVAKGTR
jgi:mevalonate kinase